MKRPNSQSLSPNKRRKVEGFTGTLARYGFQFGDTYSVEDPAILQVSLEKKLRNEDAKTSFIEGFESHLEDEEKLRKSLQSTQKPGGGVNSMIMSQSSLVRILLGIESIQKEILETLFVQIMESPEEDSDPIHKLVLRNMRWLENVFDTDWFAEKLSEVLSCLSLEKKKDLIEVLPEILTDESQDDLTDNLIETLEENNELTVHILDCLSNLALSEDKLCTTQTSVLGMLKSVKVEEIPVLLKFLCRTCEKENVKKIFDGMRTAIDPTSMESSDSAIIVPALCNAVRQKSFLGSSFNNLLSNLNEFTPFDLWLWFSLCDLTNHKAKAMQKFVSKVKQGKIEFETVEQAIAPHQNAVDGLFGAMENICEALVRNKETQLFGKDFYGILFKVFTDKQRQQDLVFKQIVHIGSQRSHEINMALDALHIFMQEDEKRMRCFVTIIKQLLDYVHFLDLAQLRKFYTIFVQLSIEIDVCTGNITIDPNFEILIQKQFSHANPDIQKMGVIGKLRILSRLSKEMSNEDTNDNIQEQGMAVADELIKRSTSMRSLMRAFTYDELSVAIAQEDLHIYLVERVVQKLQTSFEEIFFGEAPSDTNLDEVKLGSVVHFDVSSQYWFNVEGSDAATSVNIANIVCNPEKAHLMQLLCPLWNLVVILHWKTQDGLSDLDAVLGCPLLMFDEKVITEGLIMNCDHKARRLLMDCVVVAINWVREILNSFAAWHPTKNELSEDQESFNEYESKLVMRLHNLIELQTRLGMMLTYHPKYLPSWLNATRNPFTKPKKVSAAKPKKKSEGKRKRKRKSNGSEGASPSPAKQKKKAGKREEQNFEKIRAHFIELRPRIFSRLLAYEMTTESADPSESGTKISLRILHNIIFEWKRLIDIFCVNATWFQKATVGTVSPLLSHFNESSLMRELMRSFIYVRKHLFNLMRITANNEDNEELLDFVQENNGMIVSTMQMIFSALDKVIKCKKLKDSEELKSAFAYLAYEDEEEAKSATPADSFETFFNDLKTFIEGQENIEIIVSIVNLLNKIPSYCKSRARVLRSSIQEVCQKLLEKNFASENVTWNRSNLGVFLNSFVNNSSEPVKQLETVITSMVNLNDSQFKGTLTERSVGFYFQCVLPMLTKELFSLKLQDQDIDPVTRIALVFTQAGKVVANQAGNKNAQFRIRSCFLKEGCRFLDYVSRRNFIEICQENLKDSQVVEILKCGRKVLKVLHRISSEAKATSDDKLVSLIPETSKVQQKFTQEVKLLYLNKGHPDAVKFGVLKSVGLNGEALQGIEEEEMELEEPDAEEFGGAEDDEEDEDDEEEGTDPLEEEEEE